LETWASRSAVGVPDCAIRRSVLVPVFSIALRTAAYAPARQRFPQVAARPAPGSQHHPANKPAGNDTNSPGKPSLRRTFSIVVPSGGFSGIGLNSDANSPISRRGGGENAVALNRPCGFYGFYDALARSEFGPWRSALRSARDAIRQPLGSGRYQAIKSDYRDHQASNRNTSPYRFRNGSRSAAGPPADTACPTRIYHCDQFDHPGCIFASPFLRQRVLPAPDVGRPRPRQFVSVANRPWPASQEVPFAGRALGLAIARRSFNRFRVGRTFSNVPAPPWRPALCFTKRKQTDTPARADLKTPMSVSLAAFSRVPRAGLRCWHNSVDATGAFRQELANRASPTALPLTDQPERGQRTWFGKGRGDLPPDPNWIIPAGSPSIPERPVSHQFRPARLPDSDRYWLSLWGSGYR